MAAQIPDESDLTSGTLRDRLIKAPAWPLERPMAPSAGTDKRAPEQSR